MASSFSAQIDDWVRRVKGAEEAVFKSAVQELVARLNQTAPVDTGFLRASLTASTNEMPALTRTNPNGASFQVAGGQIEAVIAGSELGQTIYLGYTAQYGAYVHYYGAGGRAPRPWVEMVAQQWQEIVSEKVSEAKRAFSL